jgi:WXG100 family type VII secretion target
MQPVIQCDYEKLQKVASELQSAAAEVHRLQGAIQKQQQVLQSGGWVAPAANRFYASMNDDVNPALTRLVRGLAEANNVVRELACHFKKADEEASAGLRFE